MHVHVGSCRFMSARHADPNMIDALGMLQPCMHQLFNPNGLLFLTTYEKTSPAFSQRDITSKSHMTKARVPKVPGQTAGPSKQRTTSKSTSNPLPKQRTTLNDIPPEYITAIVQIIRSNCPKVGYGCQCAAQKKRIESRARVKGVSKWPAAAWSDPSWAFSAVSKRYRRIVFHEDTTRRYSSGYSVCCIQRVLTTPETIRANVS